MRATVTIFTARNAKNDTHQSTSDPDGRLFKKAAGGEAKLCYMGHALMENRSGLAVAGKVTHADGTAERRAAEEPGQSAAQSFRAAHYDWLGQGL